MAKLLDTALVIDLESTCWEGLPPRGQISEIIEVGICTVDLGLLQRKERRSILVRPLRSEVSPFCTELTSLTAAMLRDAEPLSDAIDILRDEYLSEQRWFVSWGDYDRDQFARNCRSYDLKYPFGPTHLNVKTLFAAAFGLNRETGIDEACARMGMELEGRHHRGVDDAWNIARLFCLLLQRMRRSSA